MLKIECFAFLGISHRVLDLSNRLIHQYRLTSYICASVVCMSLYPQLEVGNKESDRILVHI